MLTIKLVDNGIDITKVKASSENGGEIKLNGNPAESGSLYQVRASKTKDGIQNELRIFASSFNLNG